MKAIYVFCSIVLFFGVIGCKQDHVEDSPSKVETTPVVSGQSPENQRNSRPVTAGHDYNFLTDKVLIFNTVMGSEKGEQGPLKGDWMDLKPDGTYEAGRATNKTHTGKWAYEHDKQILFLRPDTQNYKLSEWKVMATDQVIVWVGTSTYGDNSIQIQLLKIDEQPK